MDFDNRKVYGDTSITDGLVYIYRVFFLTGPQGPGNFQGPELLAAPGIFQGAWKFSGPGNFQAPWKIPGSWIFPGPLENSRGVLISGQTRCDANEKKTSPLLTSYLNIKKLPFFFLNLCLFDTPQNE